MKRFLILLVSWAVLVPILGRAAGGGLVAFEPRAASFVLALPWFVLALYCGPSGVFQAFRHALAARPEELPFEARELSAARLRMLAGLSMAVGLLGFFVGSVGLFNSIATSGGQATPSSMVGGLGALLLAPVYGIVLKALLYDPLAVGLEEAESGLAGELA